MDFFSLTDLGSNGGGASEDVDLDWMTSMEVELRNDEDPLTLDLYSSMDLDLIPEPEEVSRSLQPQLIMDPFSLHHLGEVLTFWIQLGEQRLESVKELNCFVRGPTGTPYPVFLTKDPQLNQPNRVRCVWRPLESGIHKGVAFMGEEHVPGSPCTTMVVLVLEDEDEEALSLAENPSSSSQISSRIQPRKLDFSNSW